MVHKALIIDMMPRRDSLCEGAIITSFLENMGWEVDPVTRPTKEKALKALFEAYDRDLVHLSAHATDESVNVAKQGRGFLSTVEIYDYFENHLKENEMRLDDTSLVVNTGCETFSNRWCQLFLDSFRAKHYIAPKDRPYIDEGVLFPLHIYSELWSQRKILNPRRAFDKALRSMNVQAQWKIRKYHK